MSLAFHRVFAGALCVVAGSGLGYLVIANALDKGISTADRVLALAIGIAALLVVWRLEFPKGFGKQKLSRAHTRARVMNVAFGVFGVLATVIGLMAPRPVVESRPGLIEETVVGMSVDHAAIANELGVGEPTLIRQKIDGTWGEADCSVVRRFKVHDRALRVSTVRVPLGMKPHEWAFTIDAEANEVTRSGMRGSTITATERQGMFPGSSVKFRYLTDSFTERLIWDSENYNQAAPELVRCP